MLAQVAHQVFLLPEIEGDAFVVVIGNLREPHRSLRDRQKAAFHRRHRHAGDRVCVDHAIHLVPCSMDAAVHDVTGLVDVVLGRIEQDVAGKVELDEARSMHLVVEQAVRIDEERVVLARNARADVIGGHFRHAIQIDQAIARGEIGAFFPFRPTDLVADGLALAQRLDGHELAFPRETADRRSSQGTAMSLCSKSGDDRRLD